MIVTLLGLWLTLFLARGTSIGSWLHRMLVAKPAVWLSSWTRAQVILLVAMTALVVLALYLGRDAPMIMALSLPEALTTLASIEITAWIDSLILVATATSVLRGGQSISWFRTRFMPRAARRSPRAAHRHRPHRAENDDEEGAAPLAA